MDAVYSTVRQYFGEFRYPIIFLCSIVAGFIIGKGKRKILIIPSILIIVFVLNPVLKEMVDKADGGSVYWRALWLIPIIPVIALIPASIVDRVSEKDEKGNIIKIIAVFGMAGIIMFFGSTDKTLSFVEAQNVDKLPEDVISVAEILLELDEYPRIVADASISTYLRQYSGKIQTPYGRSVSYGTPSNLGKEMYGYLTSGEYSELARHMENYDYQYLVTDNSADDKKSVLIDSKFELINQVDEYGIYRVYSQKSEIREYNEKGQVISLTYVDSDGNPVNNGLRYASVLYDYDNWGHVIAETYYDVAGFLAYVDNGYAVVTNEYIGNALSLTHFRDRDGNEINMGSAYFHNYLTSLYEKMNDPSKDIVVFIAIKDEGTEALTRTLLIDLKNLGLRTDLKWKFRQSFYAVITKDEVIEEIGNTVLKHQGSINDHDFLISSSGGNNREEGGCSIVIDGKERSKDLRGMNIVVFENGEVTDSVAFDTYVREMWVTR